MLAPVQGHHDPGKIGTQVERRVVEPAPGLGVGGVVELKPPVQSQPVHDVGAHPTAHLVGGLEDLNVHAGLDQTQGRAQTGEPCPDDDDVGAFAARHGLSPRGGRRVRRLVIAANLPGWSRRRPCGGRPLAASLWMTRCTRVARGFTDPMMSDPCAVPDPAEPFAVPGFEVVELMGFGATGEVWLAREQASGEEVALKRLRPGAPAGARDRIRHEAGLLASLGHPHLVRLRAVVELADDLVLVLDHAGGGNLERLLGERGFLAPGEVVTLLTPLAQALESLHRQGVVHGDVAPANIVLDLAGRPLLADLGIARVLGTPVTAVQGREAFLDPAVLDGAPPAPSADVYALAAVGALALGGERADQSSQAAALRRC